MIKIKYPLGRRVVQVIIDAIAIIVVRTVICRSVEAICPAKLRVATVTVASTVRR
jgi:hypothetical protein